MDGCGGWVVPTQTENPVATIEILPDAEALASRAAQVFIRLADEAIAAKGSFSVALSGGSTPRLVYARLVPAPLDWHKVHFFWGDERCVPPDHPESNYRMAADVLLNHISIPTENIHRIYGELSAQAAAKRYEDDLRQMFTGELPHFDLILLGLGTDGHTASLFPNLAALKESTRWVSPVRHRTPPLPLGDRVTLTLPVINAASHIVFIVSGADKAEILSAVMRETDLPDRLPTQRISPTSGTVTWLVDKAASSSFTS
jgi:6-phosphogluconolactonase